MTAQIVYPSKPGGSFQVWTHEIDISAGAQYVVLFDPTDEPLAWGLSETDEVSTLDVVAIILRIIIIYSEASSADGSNALFRLGRSANISQYHATTFGDSQPQWTRTEIEQASLNGEHRVLQQYGPVLFYTDGDATSGKVYIGIELTRDYSLYVA